MFHPTAAPRQQRAEHVLLRTAECVHRAVEVDVDCRPVLDYGERAVAWTLDDAGGRATARQPGGLSLELVSTAPLTAAEGRAGATVLLRKGEEGTFVICSFWLVSALTEIGDVDRARRLCEKLLTHASALGLYAEELDPHTGRHLGNFPQAFSHLAPINAVMHVIRADHEHDSRPGRFAPAPRSAGS